MDDELRPGVRVRIARDPHPATMQGMEGYVCLDASDNGNVRVMLTCGDGYGLLTVFHRDQLEVIDGQ